MKLFLPLTLTVLQCLILQTSTLSLRPPPDSSIRPTPDDTPRVIPESKFAVVAPGAIRRGKPFKVVVNGFGIKRDVEILLTLEPNDAEYKEEKVVRLTKKQYKTTVKFDTTHLPRVRDNYKLTVKSGSYSNTKQISNINKANTFFIQTNKAIFLPNDLIQFRVFSIDSESYAFNPKEPGQIILTDARDNEIYKIDNVTFTNGKYEGKFRLSSSPILGTWNLKFTWEDEYKNKEIARKNLNVDEYVLPLFSASLSIPKSVAFTSSKVPVTINAQYTFGEAVDGVATISVLGDRDKVIYTKNVSVDEASTTFELDFVDDLSLQKSERQSRFTVTMVFVDPLTNTKATDKKIFIVMPYEYTLKITGERNFKKYEPYNYVVNALKLDGTPAPKGTQINVKISYTIPQEEEPVDQERVLIIGSDGSVTDKYDVDELNSQNINRFSMEATCTVCRSSRFYTALEREESLTQGMKLELISQNPSCRDKEIKLKATVSEDVDYFFFFAWSKGIMVDTQRVYFDDDGDEDNNPRTVQFSIEPNAQYFPTFRVFAYYFKEDGAKFVSASLIVNLKQDLPNYLKLSLNNADESGNAIYKPSEEINLAIETNKYSTVSLYALDQRVLLLKSGQNFTTEEVIRSFTAYNRNTRGGSENYESTASNAGFIFFTNIPPEKPPKRAPNSRPTARRPAAHSAPRKSAPRSAARSDNDRGDKSDGPEVRKNFAESFLWQDVKVYSSLYGDDYDYDSSDNRGREVITAKVPDSITTYVVYGVSMSKYDGMGLPESLPTATVFLPFFISMELPYSVKRNEVVIQSITIFNYLKRSQKVTVTVARDPRFEIVDADKNGWTVSTDSYLQQINCNDGSLRLTIALKAKIIGFIKLKVTAKGPLAGDAVEKILRVIHEGVPRSVSSSVLFAIDKASNAVDKTLTCNLPASAYTDYAEVSSTVVGDILGKALNNLDKLITMPSGCGEQTLLGFVPDVVIYKYLKATNQLTAALQATLTQYLNSGYQNELKYQRNDGGFSAFGNNDPASSTWLTAYAAWSFYLSKDYITISPAIIQSAVDFIVKQVDTDGSFKEPGRVIHSDMQGAAGKGVALTAYVTIVLSTLVDDYPSVKPQRDAAVQYLINKLNSVTDVYELGVIANALQIAGSNKANAAFNKFDAKKTDSTTETFWKKAATGSSANGARSIDIEITAYGLKLLVLRNADLGSAIKVVNYLVSQSNKFGGYGSSQDTVMALAAFSDFASAYTRLSTSLNLQLTPNVGNQLNAKVDATNALTLQSFSLNEKARQLKIHPSGTGVAIVSLTCNFYDDPSKTTPSFKIAVEVSTTCRYRTEIEICASSLTGSSSNMAIMEVRFPSGFVYQQAWWNQNANSDVSKIETFESNTIAVYYFNSISKDKTCVKVNAYRSGIVAELKPGSITINNYYDTSKSGSASFSIPAGDLENNCYPIRFRD